MGQNYLQLYLMPIILGQSFWNLKHLFYIAIVRWYKIFVYVRASPHKGEFFLLEGEFFNIGILIKNASKYAKLMVKLYVWDSLIRIYQLIFIFYKTFLNVIENRLEDKLFSFVHFWLYSADVKIVFSFYRK